MGFGLRKLKVSILQKIDIMGYGVGVTVFCSIVSAGLHPSVTLTVLSLLITIQITY